MHIELTGKNPSPFKKDHTPLKVREKSQDAELEKSAASIAHSLEPTLPVIHMANDTSESVPTNGTTPAQALADVLSILAENSMASLKDDTKGPLGKKDLKKRMQRVLSTATVRPFRGDPLRLSAANRHKGVTFPPSPQASPKERLALLTLQYQFMQFDIVAIRARIETLEIIVKFYRALVIHHHWVCANHEENVKEKHRIDIERQKAKIRELASSQEMVQSTHFDQHADDVKGKRDAIAATSISHRSPTANHRKERQNQFEQFFQYTPQCCLLVPNSCPACTSSSGTPIAKAEEQRLDLFKSLLESTTYHSTLKSTDANSSQDVNRRNAELLHEGLKLLIMLTYPTELWQPFRNATKLKNRALRRLRDLKATEDFMIEQLQCRFRYLKKFKTIVECLANNKKKKSSKPAKPAKMDAKVRERIEMDEFVASFDRRKLEALRVFWTETEGLGNRDQKRLVRKVVVANRTLPGGHWEAGEDPFWAQVNRLRELLQIVKLESEDGDGGGVGVQRAGRSLGAKVLEHAVESCRFDWRRELAGVGMELSDGDGDEDEDEDEDEEWEDVDEWREMEEGDGEEMEDGDEQPAIVGMGKGKGKENEDPHPKL